MASQQFDTNSIDPKKIPTSIYGVTLSQSQIDKAAKGEAVLLENIQHQDGRIIDAKISFYSDGDETKMKLLEKKQQLTIPEKIDTYFLSEKDKEDLLAERMVTIKLKSGSLLFVQIDKELNRVTVQGEKELKVPKEIGGYKLSDTDKATFASKKPLPIRVYFNKETSTYFLANIQLTDNGKGVEFNNFKELQQHQVAEMLKKYNTRYHNENKSQAKASRIHSETTAEKTIENKVEKNDKVALFTEFVKDRNYQGLSVLSKAGFVASPELIDKTTKQFNYTTEEKSLVQTSFKIEKRNKSISKEATKYQCNPKNTQ